jgi:hypothetical protein
MLAIFGMIKFRHSDVGANDEPYLGIAHRILLSRPIGRGRDSTDGDEALGRNAPASTQSVPSAAGIAAARLESQRCVQIGSE